MCAMLRRHGRRGGRLFLPVCVFCGHRLVYNDVVRVKLLIGLVWGNGVWNSACRGCWLILDGLFGSL